MEACLVWYKTALTIYVRTTQAKHQQEQQPQQNWVCGADWTGLVWLTLHMVMVMVLRSMVKLCSVGHNLQGCEENGANARLNHCQRLTSVSDVRMSLRSNYFATILPLPLLLAKIRCPSKSLVITYLGVKYRRAGASSHSGLIVAV